MSTLIAVLRFSNIFSAAIATGTQVMVLFALIPVVRGLSPRVGLQLHQAIDPRIDRYNPAAVAVSALTGVAILALHRNLSRLSAACYAVGLAGTLGVAVTSLRFNMRINRRLGGWSAEAVPAEYRQVRERWNRFHALRTACGVLALGCFINAGLSRR